MIFYELSNVIRLSADTSRYVVVENTKAISGTYQASTLTTLQLNQDTWYAVAAIKTADGNWKIYNKETYIMSIIDTSDSYYGILQTIKFGDTSL